MSAAAAAAAAAAQWKLGDLVLAKMKGFPAWPAMISEPEQWGLASVKNKRLVYFYGTKQIAFCSYAELEAFTEEKRRSLFAKRHGKGADFVRAVDEIIDVYDSLKEDSNKRLDLTANEVKPGEENPGDNNDILEPKGLVKSSNMGSDKKLVDHPVIVIDHNLVNADEASVVSTGSARCIVNSAPDGPTDNISMLDEMRNIPLSASSFSKKKLRDAHPQNCYTRSRAPALRRSRSSSGVGIRKVQDSCKLSGETSLASVDLVPDDNKEDSTLHKDASSGSPSMLDDVCFRSRGGTFNQPGTPGASDSNKNLSSTAKVDYTCDSEASQNGASTTEFKSNGASSLPMKSTVIFKRKRKPSRNWVPHTADCITSKMDEELQDELSGNLGDSPNSKNELNKSDGDEHLPLVKRARVRMGRPQLEASPGTDEQIDVPNNRSGVASPAEHIVMHTSNAFSADQSSAVNSVPNLSSISDMPLPSGEGHSVSKNKEYQPRVLTLDVEAALPPSKRLHRALEAMSANVAETISSLPEETGSKQLTLKDCMSSENSHSNKSADAVITTSDKSGIIEGLESSSMQFMHSSTGKTHTPGSILQNNNVVVSMKLNEPALDVTQTIAVPDRLSSSSGKPCNDVSKLISCSSDTKPLGCPTLEVNRSYDRCGEPVHLPKLLSDNNVSSDSVPHGETVLASATNLGDATSSSSLATKSSSIQSDADTRTSEVHTFSALALKELNHRNLKDRCTSPDSMPMKELIAVAQARRFSRSTSFSDNLLISKYIAKTSVSTPLKEGQGQLSPSNRIIRHTSTIDSIHSKSPFDSLQHNDVKTIAGSSEASAARKAFEAFVGTLTRTKENIARATRLAIECAKHGIAREALDIIVEHMEKETNLYKRVDLFFLVDSITQCSRNQKGGAGDLYPSLIQAILPRLLYAAAPPGNSAWENRRQCLKVLKLWLERKTLPEYIIRHHIRELEVINEASFGSSRRPSRTERALNDPLRDNEGMLVDEYGSNAGFHIPNLICTKVLENDEGSSSDDRSFEAVTPEQDAPGGDAMEESQIPVEKHRLVLEEVDGELEMEDVSPPSEAEANILRQPDQSDTNFTSYHHPSDTGPPLPNDGPPIPPPLPCSPPPVPPPPPVPIDQSTQLQATLQMASDPVGPHPPIATYNVQSQQSHPMVDHPRGMNPSVAPLHPPFCNTAPGVHQNQITPPNPPGHRSNFPRPPAPYHGSNYQHPTSSMPNGGYHLQRPPPPPPPNQFPRMPSEPHQRPQQWSNNCSSYPETYQYNGHDRDHHRHDSMHQGHDGRPHFSDRRYHHEDRGHRFDERVIRGPMHHDAGRGRFPPFPPGPPGPDQASVAPMHYGRPSDPPQGPCSGWSTEPPVPHVAGAHGCWRPR